MEEGGRVNDAEVRNRAFQFPVELTEQYGEVLPRAKLVAGFSVAGRRVPLMGPQGIFKPAILVRIPLSVTTAPIVEGKKRPYEDEISDDNLIAYRYRGKDPAHHENVGLRLAMREQTPLVYFFGTAPGL